MFCFGLLCALFRVLIFVAVSTKQYICRILNWRKKTNPKIKSCFWTEFDRFLHGIVLQLMEMGNWIIGWNAAGIQINPNVPNCQESWERSVLTDSFHFQWLKSEDKEKKGISVFFFFFSWVNDSWQQEQRFLEAGGNRQSRRKLWSLMIFFKGKCLLNK